MLKVLRALIFIFVQFSRMASPVPAAEVVPHSICPSVFSFERLDLDSTWVFPSNHNRRWRGVILVRPTIPLFVKVQFAVPGTLSSKFVGRIELAMEKASVLARIKAGSKEKIKYHLYFPSTLTLPALLSIEVNSEVVCKGSTGPGRVVTKITLEHSLYFPTVLDVQSRSPAFDDPSAPRLCGRSPVKLNPLMVQGAVAPPGAWPWILPLFKKTTLGLEFLCSGTLVSERHIITAAHCINFKVGSDLAPKDLVAYVGRYNIKNWTEAGSQPREVKKIHVYPDYDREKLSSDIAVLELTEHVTLGPLVNKICMWMGRDNLEEVVGQEAVALGWGIDELGNTVSAVPRTATMPIVSQETCLRSKPDFVYLTSNKTLCAGLRDGTGPCNGDSGGGLFIARKGNNGITQWYLRGIVSLSLLDAKTQSCDLHQFVVFTDVAKYQKWLSKIIN